MSVDPNKIFPITFAELSATNGNKLGNSMAHLSALNGRPWDDPDILALTNNFGETVAHSMARGGNLIREGEWSQTRDHDGNLPHHAYAGNGHDCTSLTKEELLLIGPRGLTVAHIAAFHGVPFLDPDILNTASDGGITVAHAMAVGGYMFDPETQAAEILIKDDQGRYVAHVMAGNRYPFSDFDTLSLRDMAGWTVAHEGADSGLVYEETNVLTLASDVGWTVAHTMASRGYVFTDPAILALEDIEGVKVSDVEPILPEPDEAAIQS